MSHRVVPLIIILILSSHVSADLMIGSGSHVYRHGYNITYFFGSNVNATAFYADDMVFNHSPRVILWNSTTPVTNTITSSNTTISVSNNTNVTLYPVNMDAIPPATFTVTVTVNSYDLDNTSCLLNFTASATNGVQIEFLVWGLSASTSYKVYKSGALYSTVSSNSSGYIDFTNVDWSSQTFLINKTPSAPSESPGGGGTGGGGGGGGGTKATPTPQAVLPPPVPQETQWLTMAIVAFVMVTILYVVGYIIKKRSEKP